MKPLSEDAWHAWSPDELKTRLMSSRLPWYIVGGWALDLWHGHQTRDHGDLEFAVSAEDVDHFRGLLSDLTFFAAREGTLSPLTASAGVPEDVGQLWGADMTAEAWRVDMMIERGRPDAWVYKRDPSIEMPRASAVRASNTGICYLAPELVLLFKAKHRREKDERDFEGAVAKLDDASKRRLRLWLATLHAGHDWISQL